MIIRVEHKNNRDYTSRTTTDIDLDYYDPIVKYFGIYDNLTFTIQRKVKKNRYIKDMPIIALLDVSDKNVKILNGNKVTVVSGLLTLLTLR